MKAIRTVVSGKEWKGEVKINHPEKGSIWVRGSGSSVFDHKGEFVSFLAIIEDINIEKTASEAINRTEKVFGAPFLYKLIFKYLFLLTVFFKTRFVIVFLTFPKLLI